jgi:hypothetical protein
MGQVASYNGLAAYPGYLLQQKLKHSCSRLRLQHFSYHALHAALHCTASAFLPACYVQTLHAAAPIFAKLGSAELC